MVCLYIDELQEYIGGISGDLASALAEARGMGLAITMAHQYRDQLPPLLRSGIDANARNKIIFGLTGKDAKEVADLSEGAGTLEFALLPKHPV